MPSRSFRFLLLLSSLGLTAVGAQEPVPSPVTNEEVTELERFIATESALADSGEILPTASPTASLGGELALANAPRAITVLTPELMRRFDIQDFSDLGRIGAGTQQPNYYGVPGTPTLRGATGGVYFNGVQRAYQRNEMPLSFGSFEALDLVKGPAPAHFGASQVGGYANLLPKSPYFDRRRSVITLEAGTEEDYRLQLDTGGPFLLGERPGAYRLSFTGQYAGTPYERVRNDFVSLYGSLKIQLSPDTTLFIGAEGFRYWSNENAGWNRPTQSLIDHGEYVIGEPISIASSAWEGRANRYLLNQNPALVVPAAIVDAGVADGTITAAQRDTLRNLADPTQRAAAYAGISPADLATIDQTTSGYQYTPAYFAAGGSVFTAPLQIGTVLAADEDFANADNALGFIELVNRRPNDGILRTQLLIDAIETDKRSSYGYAARTEQLIAELKLSYQQDYSLFNTRLISGVSARRAESKLWQDFFDEPFGRRDITQPTPSGNSMIPVGDQTDPSGVNFWSPTRQGGANAHSTLWQYSAFAFAESQPLERLRIYTSLLGTHAPYETQYPEGVDRVAPGDPRRAPISAHKDFLSASLSPVWDLRDDLHLYLTVQRGTSIDPIDGGAIIGKGNFAPNELDELGLKWSGLDNTLFATLAVYQWELSDFNSRDNLAELLEGQGWEFEFTYAPHDRFSLIGSLGHQEVRRNTPLGFRSIPLTEEQWALNGGRLNSPFSGIPPQPGYGPYSAPASNPDLEYPGTPQDQAKLHATFDIGAGFSFGLGARWSSAYWHNFDRTLRLPETFIVDASLGWRGEEWEVLLQGFNLTDEDYFIGAEPVFGANTLITKGPGPTGKLVVTRRF